MPALVMGMRANEIVSHVVRNLDDDGKLLWIPDSKTEAGRRTLQVPELLRPMLKALAEGKSPEAKLFGHHWRDWVRKWVKRICEAGAEGDGARNARAAFDAGGGERRVCPRGRRLARS